MKENSPFYARTESRRMVKRRTGREQAAIPEQRFGKGFPSMKRRARPLQRRVSPAVLG